MMTGDHMGLDMEVSRRRLLIAAGLAPGLLVSSGIDGAPSSQASALPGAPSGQAGMPAISGLHLQFGGDAASEVTVSWHTLLPVVRPCVLLGRLDGRLEQTAEAAPSQYVDGKSGRTVHAYHAKLGRLKPDTAYMYAAVHDGADPEFGTFRTAPRGRAAFTFTSFGDQGTPTMGRQIDVPAGSSLRAPLFVNDNLGSPAAGDTALGVERLRPLFHLFNGDLCYANLAHDRVRTWWDFWENNTRSARNRPWMPSPGNHENELGNGLIGYKAYQTFFAVPPATGQTDVTRGLWYAFTAGSVRVISIANDDVAYQDAGDSYVRGYSAGAQKTWLAGELAATRADRDIDWIVVCMHQAAISTADKSNGADLGIREEWVPLFDKYNVDLVVCGHEHHYERSHPIRGQEANQTLTPKPQASAIDVIDTTRGTVHMVIGGGGTSAPTNERFFDPPRCEVTVSVGAPDPTTGRRPSVCVTEDAHWSAVRNTAHPYGFAAFRVDPGAGPGAETTMRVTYYDVVGLGGELAPFETFTLRRPRRD
ncbi:purple acid phosphatase family protein [Methylobacterium sp. CM6257]